MADRNQKLRWTAATTPGGDTRIVLHGVMLGALPRAFLRDLRALHDASDSLLLDLAELDRTDTPAVEALRRALAPLRHARVLLAGDWAPTSHLLADGLRGTVPFEGPPRTGAHERRQHHRYTTRVEVRLALNTGQIVTGTTADVSRGGLRATRLHPGSRTSLHGDDAQDPLGDEGSIGTLVRVEIPALGLQWRAARVVGGDGARRRTVRVAFDEACADLFAA